MAPRHRSGIRASLILALLLGAGASMAFSIPGWRERTGLAPAHVEANPYRRDGQAGLYRFISEHWTELHPVMEAIDRGEPITPDDSMQALLDHLDRIAGQKDALWSRLYWHTDMDSVLAEAEARGVPVLSLRLLGRLDESLSCANSRFFRTVLYPNAEVSRYLRDHFVLHWHTVRDAPVLTVDFGNGRKLQQTITGNSIHYVIAPSGEVVDALPGLYTPGMFLDALREAESNVAIRLGRFDGSARVVAAAFGAPEPMPEPVRADVAGVRALSKFGGEFRPLRNLVQMDDAISPATLLASDAFRVDDADMRPVFDARSRSLALSQLAGTGNDAERAERMFATFETTARADSAMNHTELRPKVLALLTDPVLREWPVALDERIYDEVFLSPVTDQWAGLVDPDAYTGLWSKDLFPPKSDG